MSSPFEITEIRIKLTGDPTSKLKAFCSITFADAFVIRDVKVIEGARGPFVAMPSRKLCDHCPRCQHKNHLRATYCNECGQRLDPDRATRAIDRRVRLHADLAHPINSATRIHLHRAIVQAYAEEVEKSKMAGYKPASFDDLDLHDGFLDEDYVQELQRREQRRREQRDECGGAADA